MGSGDVMARIGGVLFIAVAVVIAVHTVVEPLYHVSTEGQPYSPVWDLLDPLMVVTVALGALLAWRRKRAVDQEADGPVTREFLAANVLFFGFLFVGFLLLWSWFNLLSPGYTAAGPETASLVWMVIDAGLPLLSRCHRRGLAQEPRPGRQRLTPHSATTTKEAS